MFISFRVIRCACYYARFNLTFQRHKGRAMNTLKGAISACGLFVHHVFLIVLDVYSSIMRFTLVTLFGFCTGIGASHEQAFPKQTIEHYAKPIDTPPSWTENPSAPRMQWKRADNVTLPLTPSIRPPTIELPSPIPNIPSTPEGFFGGPPGHGRMRTVEIGLDGNDGFDFSLHDQRERLQISNLYGQCGLFIAGGHNPIIWATVGARFSLHNADPVNNAVQKALTLSNVQDVKEIVIIAPKMLTDAYGDLRSRDWAFALRDKLQPMFPYAHFVVRIYPIMPISATSYRRYVYSYTTGAIIEAMLESKTVVTYPPRSVITGPTTRTDRVQSRSGLSNLFSCLRATTSDENSPFERLSMD